MRMCGYSDCDYSMKYLTNLKRHMKKNTHLTDQEREKMTCAEAGAKVEEIEGATEVVIVTEDQEAPPAHALHTEQKVQASITVQTVTFLDAIIAAPVMVVKQIRKQYPAPPSINQPDIQAMSLVDALDMTSAAIEEAVFVNSAVWRRWQWQCWHQFCLSLTKVQVM